MDNSIIKMSNGTSVPPISADFTVSTDYLPSTVQIVSSSSSSSSSTSFTVSAPPETTTNANNTMGTELYQNNLIHCVRTSVIGDDNCIPGPLGPRKITYCDNTASGRGNRMIEDPILHEVLPFYSNTHTHTSLTGIQSHNYLEEARNLVRDGIHAHEKDDAVLFTYKGSTHASNMVKHFLLGSGPSIPSASSSSVSVSSSLSSIPDSSSSSLSSVHHTCTFPGCNRSFISSADLLIHARTHPDGESTAYRTPLLSSSSSSSFPANSDSRLVSSSSSVPLSSLSTVVLVGPYAHHSSFLPYIESGITLHHIKENKVIGGVDYIDLLSHLVRYRSRSSVPHPNPDSLAPSSSPVRIIGLFTMASNITGTLCDIYTITAILHAFQGTVVWDGAAAVPHLPVYMNSPRKLTWESIRDEIQQHISAYVKESSSSPSPSLLSLFGTCSSILSRLYPHQPLSHQEYSCCLDALYFSMHKFVGGGIGTPGILVIKRHLIHSYVPYTPGGGTVFYVSKDGIPQYLGNDTDREEGGSPDVIGSVRAGLCWHLLQSIGWSSIMVREYTMYKLAYESLATVPNLTIFGTQQSPQVSSNFRSTLTSLGKYDPSVIPSSVPILSFLIHHPHNTNNLYHWGYICSLLNDIFGIQTRGGCLCAGIYSQDLLRLEDSESSDLKTHLLNKEELLRPGFIRISFVYHLSYAEYQYIIEALVWIAKNAEYLLPYYTPFSDTGEWRVNRSKLHTLLDRERTRKSSKTEENTTNRSSYWNYSFSYKEAYDYIQNSYSGNGAGHLEAAQKGTIQNHPTRRWLQDIKYRVNDNDGNRSDPNTVYGTGYHHPNHTIKLNLQRLQQTISTHSSETSSTSTDQLLLRLFACYLIEADTLIQAIKLNTSSSGLTNHDPSALLSVTGQSLRWFILSNDIEQHQTKDDTVSTNVPWILGQRIYTMYHRSTNEIGSGKDTKETKEDIETTFTLVLCRILHKEYTELTDKDDRQWNGTDIEVRNVEATNTDALPNDTTVTHMNESVKSVRSSTKVPKDPTQNRKFQQMNNAILSTTFQSPSVPHASDTPSSSSTSSRTDSFSLPPVIIDDLLDRKRLLASSQIALQSLHIDKVPRDTARALQHGIRDAILDFGMIRHGDRIMVGLSGGKDSMTLLIQLLRLQSVAPVSFTIAAATVDPQYEGYDPTPLKEWCQSIGIPHYFESAPVMDIAAEKMGNDSICSFCSRIKRGLLYTACRREGYNVLALGQHADDCAESFVMSAFRNGRLRTMKAHYLTDEGDIRIIRPLVYVRERHTRIFAHHVRLPIIPENCPACFSGPTIRYKIKRLLAAEESTNPSLFHCLLQAIHPLMLSEGEAAMRDIGKKENMVPVLPTKEPPHLKYLAQQRRTVPNVTLSTPDHGTEKTNNASSKEEEKESTGAEEPLYGLFGGNEDDDF